MAAKDQSPALAPSSGRVRLVRARTLAGLCALGLGAAALLCGCGSAGRADRAPSVAVGRRAGPSPRAQLAAAATLAKRFAASYAAAAYRRDPPALPGESAAVARQVALAAQRVPPSRRGLRPRLRGLALAIDSPARLAGAARIADSRNPPFGVSFTLARRGGRWRVISISTPE